LSHIKCFLHGHRKGHPHRENKASQQEGDVNEVNVVSDASWRANESKTFEMGNSILDKGQ